jgi:hypothetical protein
MEFRNFIALGPQGRHPSEIKHVLLIDLANEIIYYMFYLMP